MVAIFENVEQFPKTYNGCKLWKMKSGTENPYKE